MRNSDRVGAVVVAIPARDEDRHIVACVQSALTAIRAVGRELVVVVVVASDGSTDFTDALVEAMSRDEPLVHLKRGDWRSAGGARRAAVDHGLAMLASAGHTTMNDTWIATTDADTVVSADWLVRQLHHAEAGHDALAGIVDLVDDADRSAELMATFVELYELGTETHSHVHGANLGIRASAYLAADGFPDVTVSEDHALWNELRRQKFRVLSPIDLCVSTSGRLRGRAVGGFADTWKRLMSDVAHEGVAAPAAAVA